MGSLPDPLPLTDAPTVLPPPSSKTERLADSNTQLTTKDVCAALNSLTSTFVNGDGEVKIDDTERKEVLRACEGVRKKWMSPDEKGIEMMFSSQRKAAVRLAIDMGIFKAMGKKEVVDAKGLAEECGAEVDFVVRIMRLLNAIGFVEETGLSKWRNTPMSRELATDKGLIGGLIHTSDIQGPTLAQLPTYHRTHGFNNPTSSTASPFNHGLQTSLPMFEYLKTVPFQYTAMNDMMAGRWRARNENWWSYYPIISRISELSSNFTPKVPLWVDIGGGIGDDLLAFKKAMPELSDEGKYGRFLLQDTPAAIAEASAARQQGVDTQPHDFFDPEPQSARGARFYYLRTVIHDWPDHSAAKILGHVADAMVPGSRLLINEFVIPDTDAPLLAAQNDFIMMTMFGARERTVGQWRELLEGQGMELMEVHRSENMSPADRCLIEARLRV